MLSPHTTIFYIGPLKIKIGISLSLILNNKNLNRIVVFKNFNFVSDILVSGFIYKLFTVISNEIQIF